MSHIVNHPSFIEAALDRRKQLLAECERERLAAAARASTHPFPKRTIRVRCGNALIRWGQRIAATVEAPIVSESSTAPDTERP